MPATPKRPPAQAAGAAQGAAVQGAAGTAAATPAMPTTVGSLSGRFFVFFHAFAVYLSFFGALAIGWYLHYMKIVKNSSYGWPQEWFPSISATIGDWYPERNFFQLFMALASGPRFALVLLSYWLLNSAHNIEHSLSSTFPKVVFVLGFLRAAFAGGWTYITSSDDHDAHDVFMIGYLVLSLVYYLVYGYALRFVKSAPSSGYLSKHICAGLFLLNLIPLIYFFIQHKVHNVPGAYSYYAYFEWALVFIDVGFDTASFFEFGTFSVVITDSAPRSSPPTNAGKLSPVDSVYYQNMFWSLKELISDIYLAFISWTLFSSVGTMIWYFPLFNMSLSGEEATILLTLFPAFLSLPGFLWIANNTNAFLQLVSLAGIACYLVEHPSLRLIIGGVACAINLVAVQAQWFQNPERRDRAAVAYVLGILLSVVVRIWTTSTNPLWPIVNATNGGMQIPGLIIAVVCLLDQVIRPFPPEYTQSADSKRHGNGVAAGLGFGGVLFLTHLLFSDVATLPRYIWTGFPDHGPEPFPHGLALVPALALGLFLSTKKQIVQSFLWWAVASIGCTLFYYSETWIAFAGGLVLAVYIASMWPLMISAVSKHAPSLGLGLGMFTCIMLYFGSAWVVAYAFVPGGEYMREHTEYILGAAMVAILIGLIGGGGQPLFSETSLHKKGTGADDNKSLLAKFKAGEHLRFNVGLTIILLLTAAAAYTRIQAPIEYKVLGAPNDKVVTGGIWTIHFGYDNRMWASHERMAALINDSQVDFVGLLESDTMRIFMGNRDVPMMIAEKLGMYLDYGPRTRDHTWGCALLSKFPIVWSKHYLLPSPEGELACAIHATLDVAGEPLDVLVAHNGQEETPLDRDLQSKLEGEIMRNATNPIIFLGYVVTKPHGSVYKNLVEGGNAKDIDPTDTDRWCEYIVYRNLEKIGYARISHGGITDTEMQIARFKMGTGVDNTDEIPSTDMPKGLRFTKLFNGKGIRGHRYHVHDGPKYFGKIKTKEEKAN